MAWGNSYISDTLWLVFIMDKLWTYFANEIVREVKWLPYADSIIALGPKGTLQQMGTYEELVTKPGYVQELKLKISDPAQESEMMLTTASCEFDEGTQTPMELANSETGGQNHNKSKPSTILFYIGSMGWIRFLAFLLLVAVEVVTNSMQCEPSMPLRDSSSQAFTNSRFSNMA